MMIDKEKTIKKAISRYNYLFPVRGKHSISECFFCLRGETYLIFTTKNKKIHKVKAEIIRPPVFSPAGSREAIDALFKTLNKPIILRSLITKKPVKACLINLFPVPGVTWLSNTIAASDTSVTAELTHSSAIMPVAGSHGNVGPVTGAAFPSAPVRVQGLGGNDVHTFPADTCYIVRDTSLCKYEILANGLLPICQFTDMLPTPGEASGYGRVPSNFRGAGQGATSRVPEPEFILPHDVTTFHYEVLAPGLLHRRPPVEWRTISNPCVAGYVHERSPILMDNDFIPTPAADRLHSVSDYTTMNY